MFGVSTGQARDAEQREILAAIKLLEAGEVSTVVGLVKYFQESTLKEINTKLEKRHLDQTKERQRLWTRVLQGRTSTAEKNDKS